MSSFEKREESKDKKTLLREQFENIFEKNTLSSLSDIVRKRVEKLLESEPEFLESVLFATKDLRETSEKIVVRAQRRIEESRIELVPNDQYSLGGLSTPEGVKLGKLDAPNIFTDPDGYETFMGEQNEKTPYRGLDEKQREAMLQSMLELGDALRYRNNAKSHIDNLLRDKIIAQENKERYGGSFSYLEATSIPIEKTQAEISGKLAKLKYLPGFTADRIKAIGEKLKDIFNSKEDAEQE